MASVRMMLSAVVAFTLCGATASAAPPPVLGDPQSAIKLDCSSSRFVLRVALDVFATGFPVAPGTLRLGRSQHACPVTSSDHDLLIVVFDYGLLDCGSHRMLTNTSMVYYNNFYHVPQAGANIPDRPFNYSVECEYPRRGAVSFVRDLLPQSETYSSVVEALGSLNFSLTIMDDEWLLPRPSLTFLLGGPVNVEARVASQQHPDLRLFLDACVASPGGAGGAGGVGDLQYGLVLEHGCLMDSRNSSALFMRPEDASALRLTFQAFAFTDTSSNSSSDEIFLHCDLRVADGQDPFSSTQKSCSYDQAASEWVMVDAPARSDLCSCCEEGRCEAQGAEWRRRRGAPGPAGESQRVSVGPVRVLGPEVGAAGWSWEDRRGAPVSGVSGTHGSSTPTVGTTTTTTASALLYCLAGIILSVSILSCLVCKAPWPRPNRIHRFRCIHHIHLTAITPAVGGSLPLVGAC